MMSRRFAFAALITLACSAWGGHALGQQPESFLGPSVGAPSKRARNLSARAEPYRALIWACSQEHGLEPALVYGVIEVESYFDSEAVSRVGARGLMQLMPVVEQMYGVEDVFDPHQNIAAGCAYLAHLLRAYDGRLAWALAAYNAGPGRVRRSGGPPTHNYVRRVLRARARWRLALGSSSSLALERPDTTPTTKGDAND